jgi:formylglycine-generating enzyme required for sulfatase activity
VRGGAWFLYPQDCRAAYRVKHTPTFGDNSIGFRVCLDL